MSNDSDLVDPLRHHAAGPSAHQDPHPPAGVRRSLERPPTLAGHRRGVMMAVGVLVAVVALGGAVAVVATRSSAATASTLAVNAASPFPGTSVSVTAPRAVSAAELARLPQATTFGEVTDAPQDSEPDGVPDGRVVHPSVPVPAFVEPGGAPVAVIPATELVSPTWLPVVASQPGWRKVLLPSRPNSRAAWIYLDTTITVARDPYVIRVDREHFTLALFKDSNEIGRWAVGVGKAGSPTPVTRTFVMASIRDTHPTFSPIILATGAHSDTYTTYGGGPGTVGIHGWPTSSVFGTASSDGCVRVPADALQVLSTTVPLGTPVLIS